MNYRTVQFDIPLGDFVEKQSSGDITVHLNLDNLNSDTIAWLFRKGLTLAIRNAYANVKDPAKRQIEAQRKADEIAENVQNAGRSSSWSTMEAAMIRTYVNFKYGGQMPTGGMNFVWRQIATLDDVQQAELRNAAKVMLAMHM